MAPSATKPQQPASTSQDDATPRVTERTIVSEPNRVIQVERVTVSVQQSTAVSAAIRTGRQSGSSD